MRQLMDVAAADTLIAGGAGLHIAGDEAALKRLGRGNWIGGTIPYFTTEAGGVVDRERVFVDVLPTEATIADIALVGAEGLAQVLQGAPNHGFTLVVVPGLSPIHLSYALQVPEMPGLFEHPIVGWIAGAHLSELGQTSPKVFNGRTGEASDTRLVMMQVKLPDSVIPAIGIVNIFEQGDGDRFVFPDTGFAATTCLVNGRPVRLVDHLKAAELDLRLPLVANMSGEMINVSFRSLDEAAGAVHFYAPVIAGVEYRQAKPVADYAAALMSRMPDLGTGPIFACNCILNFLYGNLEGEARLPVGGPATFGEIAYGLLNQTIVYLALHPLG